MISRKEQFMLALQGWTSRGILDDWYRGPGYSGSIQGTCLGVEIPKRIIDSIEHKDDQIVLFLTDKTYYVLGTKQHG